MFFIDFATAMLANIMHSRVTQEWFKMNPTTLIDVTNRLLVAISQKKVATSTLIHLLISLSYLNKSSSLRKTVEGPECRFNEKISAFVEVISKQPLTEQNLNDRNMDDKGAQDDLPKYDDENGDIDKRTIMDLCAYMFHPNRYSQENQNEKESKSMDESAEEFLLGHEVGEFNDMCTDDRIKEFENEQGDLIFECFQDEELMFI